MYHRPVPLGRKSMGRTYKIRCVSGLSGPAIRRLAVAAED